jgi:phosphoglycolate phosphatase-like HAD superfamily hydrolase
VHDVPPFPGVRESLQELQGKADIFVVSATPNEALTREWEENDLRRYVERICGQEVGSKNKILELARKYPPGHALMVGDAPGDRKAAKANDVLFFPINPGHEDASWQRLLDEGIDRFLNGTFAGEYEDRLNEEFESYLPEHPPWQSPKS